MIKNSQIINRICNDNIHLKLLRINYSNELENLSVYKDISEKLKLLLYK